jgi:ribonuclease BN (tRNA processing enzyme)
MVVAPTLSLTVLGCDGSWTGPGGAGSGYLVHSGATTLLMEAGPGTFARLQQHLDPASIDAVFLSHHHPDHWTDLHPLVTHARYALGRERIPIYAPAGLGERTHLAHDAICEWLPVTDGDSAQLGDLGLAFHRTDHSFETLAVRVDGASRALGYSADTGPGWSLSELGTGLHLVLCEATYTIEHEGTAGHMSGRQAGDQARHAGAQRLVITHRWPTVDASVVAAEAVAAFGGPVEQAVIGKEFLL